jgi:hypothetical protein
MEPFHPSWLPNQTNPNSLVDDPYLEAKRLMKIVAVNDYVKIGIFGHIKGHEDLCRFRYQQNNSPKSCLSTII